MGIYCKKSLCLGIQALQRIGARQHRKEHQRVESGIRRVRLHERDMQGAHGLAAVLASLMGVVRTGHAVAALHCLVRR